VLTLKGTITLGIKMALHFHEFGGGDDNVTKDVLIW